MCFCVGGTIDWVAVEAIATVFGALGTFLAFVAVIWQFNRDQRRRNDEDDLRQASQVAAWYEPLPDAPIASDTSHAVISNGSTAPVYGMVVWYVVMGNGPTTGEAVAHGAAEGGQRSYQLISTVPPGPMEIPLPPVPYGAHALPGIEIGFSDASNRHWIRRSDGAIERINEMAWLHYGVDPWGPSRQWPAPDPDGLPRPRT